MPGELTSHQSDYSLPDIFVIWYNPKHWIETGFEIYTSAEYRSIGQTAWTEDLGLDQFVIWSL